MFVYASRVLAKLQQKKKYLSQQSTTSTISHEPMARQFSRQLSTVTIGTIKKVKNQKEKAER